MTTIASQQQRLLAHLKLSPITPLEALRYMGIARLAARIWELKRMGHHIVKEMVEVTNHRGEVCKVAKYWLIKEERMAA